MKKRMSEPFFSVFEIALSDDLGAKDIQILKVGSFKHPVYGDIEITPDDLIAFKESFERKVRKIDLAINYDHEKTVAAGWISNLSIKAQGKELWAVPDWTSKGLKSVKDKDYRYFSAELAWEYTDAETGEKHKRVLLGGALTNYPFIKGMKSIEASEKINTQSERKSMKLSELILHLSELGYDFNEMKARAEKLTEVEKQNVSLSETVSKQNIKISALETQNVELSEKVKNSEKEKADLKFAQLTEKGMREGKLTKAFAEGQFKSLYEKMGVEFAENMLKELPKIVATEFSGDTNSGDETTGSKDAGVELAEKATKRAAADKIPFSQACDLVLSENPKLAKEYEKLGRD